MDTDGHCKEVYAYFGLTAYNAQCAEQSIMQLIIIVDFFEAKVDNFTTKENWVNEFDKFDQKLTKKTMGRLIGHLKNLNYINEEVENDLKIVLDKRNWLSHRYFADRTLEFLSKDGRNSMINELISCIQIFDKIQTLLNQLSSKLLKKYGATEKVLKEIEKNIMLEAKCDI